MARVDLAMWIRPVRILAMILAVTLFVLCVEASAAQAQAAVRGERRIALIIGNGAYLTGPLKNPVNDAQDMNNALKNLGFDVTLKRDAGLDVMIDLISDFGRRVQTSDVRLFYYAGHAIQFKGKNYLLPVDAVIDNEGQLPGQTVDISYLLERLGTAQGGLNIVILDACRNNPFADVARVGPDGRAVRFRGSAARGLAPVDAPQGTLVAFATAPGAIAMDGGNSRNSLYTKHLLEYIGVPALPVEQMFKRVRIAVAQETQRLQIPWESSSLMGDFCFKTGSNGACRYDGAPPTRP